MAQRRDHVQVAPPPPRGQQAPRVVLRAADGGCVAKAGQGDPRRHARTERYPCRVSSAQRFQLKPAARFRPASIRRPRTLASVSTDSTALDNPATSVGSTSRAPSPRTSGRHDAVLATTGVPTAIASRGGKPKPSYSEGYTTTPAAASASGMSSRGSTPRQT